MKDNFKVLIIYLASYILPMPIYAMALFGIVTAENIRNYSENTIFFSIIVGMTLIITAFNYISYKKAFKYLDEQINKRIFKWLVLFNIVLTFMMTRL